MRKFWQLYAFLNLLIIILSKNKTLFILKNFEFIHKIGEYFAI